jgi:hypothetical protein
MLLLAAALLCVFAPVADAQFRTPMRSPPQAPIRPLGFQNFPRQPFITSGFNSFGFNSFGAFPMAPTAQARNVRGNFNNGVFTPSPFGPFALSSRGVFEPVQGSFTRAVGGPFVLSTRGFVNPQTGNFVPSTAGGIVLRERGILNPTIGDFTQSARGSFNPFTGAFQPNANGNFALRTPGLFVPSRGTFVPSAVGNFVLTSRGSINPLTGQVVPSQNGNFEFTTRGTFVPSNRFANAAGIPSAPLTSLGINTGTPTVSPFFWGLMGNANAMAFNPYMPVSYPSAIPYAGAGYGNGGYGGGYGNSYYPSGGYGQQAPQNNIVAAPPAAPVAAPQQPTALDAFGLPTEKGALAWPLAFKLMPPEERRALLQPAESSVNAALNQAAAGKVAPAILEEARSNVGRLRSWLRERRLDLAEGTYEDASRFLRKIEDVLART